MLTPKNYGALMHALWHLEQHSMIADLQTFSLTKVQLKFSRRQDPTSFLALELPGLAESRPSILRGDRICVRDDGGQMHVGFVHHINMTEVLLKFHITLHERHIDGHLYDVEFILNSTLLRKRHLAIDQAVDSGLLNHLLPSLPAFDSDLNPPLMQRFNWSNKSLNTQQQSAVNSIVQRLPGKPPFIIFGPPGTGKTSTVVEAIFQVSAFFYTVHKYIILGYLLYLPQVQLSLSLCLNQGAVLHNYIILCTGVYPGSQLQNPCLRPQ
jgi:helicase MOV-10